MSDELAGSLLLAEYERVKSEQAQRIGFRDNMLFVHLASTGAVASWVLSNASSTHARFALLVIPWICIVLGWTYIVNDQHISRIGVYTREILERRARALLQTVTSIEVTEADAKIFVIAELFGWETFHRTDANRTHRKKTQLIVDLLTFCVPGGLAIGVFGLLEHAAGSNASGVADQLPMAAIATVVCVECAALVFLAAVIYSYSDLSRGRDRSEAYRVKD